MPQLPSTPRPSARETLEDLYNNINSSQQASTAAGTSVRNGIRGGQPFPKWSSARLAGGEYPETGISHNNQGWGFIDGSPAGKLTKDWAQTEFRPRPTTRVTRFTDNGLNYASNTLGINREKYRG